MKFRHGTRRRALEYEKDLVQKWKKDKTFEKSVENRPKIINGFSMMAHLLLLDCHITVRY